MYVGAMKDKQSTSQLVVKNISHNYGSTAVLKDLSFSVNHGEVVVLVGPSGCGKTTLLNLLSGYIEPVEGSIVREGVTRTVYQQDGLFPWLTVAENITIGLRPVMNEVQRQQELRELVELIHLEGFRKSLPAPTVWRHEAAC